MAARGSEGVCRLPAAAAAGPAEAEADAIDAMAAPRVRGRRDDIIAFVWGDFVLASAVRTLTKYSLEYQLVHVVPVDCNDCKMHRTTVRYMYMYVMYNVVKGR